MGFTFRKRVKLMKGVHLNLGKTGTSVSVGGKGFSVTKGRGRTSVSVGAPGTGLSYRASSADRPQSSTPMPAGPAETGDEAQRQAAYEAGRGIAELGLFRWIAGKAMRVLGAFLMACTVIGLLSAIGDGPTAASWPAVVAMAALAAAFWFGGARVLRR